MDKIKSMFTWIGVYAAIGIGLTAVTATINPTFRQNLGEGFIDLGKSLLNKQPDENTWKEAEPGEERPGEAEPAA